jgi:hypothetical protein
MEKPVEHYIADLAGSFLLQVAVLSKKVDDLAETNAILVEQLQAGAKLVADAGEEIKSLNEQIKALKGE